MEIVCLKWRKKELKKIIGINKARLKRMTLAVKLPITFRREKGGIQF